MNQVVNISRPAYSMLVTLSELGILRKGIWNSQIYHDLYTYWEANYES